MSEELEDLEQFFKGPQPTRTGRHRPARRFDQTQLRAESHGRQVNRDYLAHFLRWTTVKALVKYQVTRVLDIGCGQDQPLVRVLTHQLAHVPAIYVGVDLNKITHPSEIAWTQTIDQFNFVERWKELNAGAVAELGFDVITCFEVIEHMGVKDGLGLLKGARELLSDDGTFLLSTPVFSGKAAVNHVHEYGVEELRAAIQGTGLKVQQRQGTFGDTRELYPVLSPEERWCWERWATRLGNDGLSAVFATLHPDQCKNVLWWLTKA